MRWFNSLPFNNAFAKGGKWVYSANMTDDKFDNGTTQLSDDGNKKEIKPWKVMQGDMAVHFAGATAGTAGVRDSWMGRWLDRAEAMLPGWANETTQVALRDEVEKFWAKTAVGISTARKKLHLGDTLQTDQSAKPGPKDEKPKDEKPKDEKPKDEKPKDEKPKDEKPKDEKPKDEKPKTKSEKPPSTKPDATSNNIESAVPRAETEKSPTDAISKENAETTPKEGTTLLTDTSPRPGTQQFPPLGKAASLDDLKRVAGSKPDA